MPEGQNNLDAPKAPEAPKPAAEQAPEKLLTPGVPIDAPVADAAQNQQPPAVEPEKQPEPVKPLDAPKTEEKAPSYDPSADMAKLKSMPMGEMIKELLQRLGDFFKSIGSLSGKLGTVNLFTPDDVKKLKVDLEKDREKKFVSENRAVEYVCSVLNLPLKDNAKNLLAALKGSTGFEYKTDKNELKNAQLGDVLFFQKADKPGEPYMTAVVSKLQPLSIKMVADAGAPREVELAKSPLEKEFMALVKIPAPEKI